MLPKNCGTFNINGTQLKDEFTDAGTVMYQDIELAPAFLIHVEAFYSCHEYVCFDCHHCRLPRVP